MPYLLLPNAGNEFSAATLIRWLKAAGEPFVAGDGLAELETENGLLIVEAVMLGRLAEVVIQPGQTLAVGARLARIEAATSSQVVAVNSVRTEQAMLDERR